MACSVSALQVKTVPLLDAVKLLICAGMLTYLELQLFFLISFYNGPFFVLMY
jgi:hypothetical protein